MVNCEVMEKEIWDSLKRVMDPELQIDIVSLGLIYGVSFEKAEAKIKMTLTSPGCPLAGVIEQLIRKELLAIKEIKSINIEIVWEPPWTQEMMSEEAKAELGYI